MDTDTQQDDTTPTGPRATPTPHHHQQPPAFFSMRRRVQLCLVMFVVEGLISFEEIFMLPVLQRVDVPLVLVSLPGTISGAIGVFIIPLLGWASDRPACCTCCSKHCGQKRPFALFTLTLIAAGLGLLIFVTSSSLYDGDNKDGGIFNNSSRSQVLSETAVSPHSSTHANSWLTNNASTIMVAPETNQSQETTDGSTGFISTTSLSVTAMGVVSFVLLEYGYDSSYSTVRAYMITVTPASQHDDIFILGTLVGAVGGFLTSLLGFVDLAALYPDTGAVLDKGMAQCLTQAVILMLTLLVLGTVSLMTGSESLAHVSEDAATLLPHDTEIDCDDCGTATKEVSSLASDSQLTNNSEHSEVTPLTAEPTSHEHDGCLVWVMSTWNRWKQWILLCVMTFLGMSTNDAYFVYVTNYVARVIFKGNPNAPSESEDYKNYVEGVHIASLGMLMTYGLLVVWSVFQHRILNKIGMRGEYLGASVACGVLLVSLIATDNVVVFFLNAVTMAVFRTTISTVPLILSNNLAKQQFKEGSADQSTNRSGIAMATIFAMTSASYFLVSLVMGPLMDVTGYPGVPLVFATGSCVLQTLSAVFVRFE
ncbi:membrane-associated transporter protein-like [Babylonia areolata]|uniref:membrane-associated transporter protein-like n=1 Tax=Babylonia areolata TaxID=304850 RepID=UPI003FD53D53